MYTWMKFHYNRWYNNLQQGISILFIARDESDEEKLILNFTEQCNAWISMESSRSNRHWLPWKADFDLGEGEDDCEDTERIVLFEDISKFLFIVDTVEQKFQLLWNFLNFLSKVDKRFKYSTEHDKTTLADCHLDNVFDVFTTLDIKNIFSSVLKSDIQLEFLDSFFDNIYSHSLELFEGHLQTLLTLRYIDFKLEQFEKLKEKQVKKQRHLLKSLLKLHSNRNNHAIWMRFIKFEYETGNQAEARKAFRTVIKMSGSDVTQMTDRYQRCITIKLFRAFAELESRLDDQLLITKKKQEIEKEQIPYVVGVLTTAADANLASLDSENNFQPTKVLKCQKNYQLQLDKCLDFLLSVTNDVASDCLIFLPFAGDMLVHWIACFALYQYFTVGIKAACQIYEDVQSKIRSVIANISFQEKDSPRATYQNSVLRLCSWDHLHLLEYHQRYNSASLNIIRLPLLALLDHFPDGKDLLQVFVDLESASYITGRLRNFFQRTVQRGINSPYPWLFAFLSEYKRIYNLRSFQSGWYHKLNPLKY